MRKKAAIALTFFKFMSVGILNVIVDLGILNFLLWISPERTKLVLFFINTLAVICAIINSYFWNKKWTFSKQRKNNKFEKIQFIGQALLNIAINDLITVFLSSYFINNKELPFFLSSNLSKIFAMFCSSLLSYLIMKKIIFKTPPN